MMRTKPLILCDVDSTLTDSEAVFARVAEEAGLPWVKKAYWWFQAQDVGVDRATLSNMFRRCHSREVFLLQKPYKGARDVLEGLSQFCTIWYVSNRHPQAQSTLEDWISMNGFPCPENVLATKDKRAWITEQIPDIVIDDRVATMIHARDEGCEVFSLKHNHNVNLSGNEVTHIHICDDWWIINDQIHQFLGLEVLA